ncbi:E3 ubiquitin/ISG15 ligase TRIM25-like [Triplophysa rosa]|uniref:E3 ubiquitin/ISG15 ligase TRIM25-like n=1 Tax=Triplophysa rosa TaxID=992332 RepID=UPI0025462515|nr:E3 ubiquitin/ISG15 ligase TRIM25-like [Triplophysa rosa]XP_057208682.1 E3 ubiquitin/ISG15 ligase TRIM25-like [Triplophysa rosa]XP_057208683.1 E3 ubiquitin/ISG15 ligase TRIM25-like [Triplophysa rosa]XP_057208685.1 E3 ubiquitin/ISG15 ligase TRIM25-like [Triplophysa rosa]
MAEAILGEQDRYSCAICLDLLKDPVTIPCGHSYCMRCIDKCWNTEDPRRAYSCPQCRHIFNSKPSLNRSTVLAEIMERVRDTTPQVSESAQSLAGPGDIACDFCQERKFKAVKSCLECLCSYCENHLHPHYNVPALKKHKLVKATIMATCSKHDKLLEVYCRTDQKCVCTHCLLDDHKGHDTVPSTVERNEKKKKLKDNQKKVKQTIQTKEKELHKMTTNITSHSNSAEKAVEDSKRIFTELVRFVEMRSAKIIEKIEAYQKADLDQGADLQEKLLLEITELQRRDGVQERLLQTDDNIHFLQNFESVSSESDHFPRLSFKPCCSYTDVSKLTSELKQRLETVFDEEISKTLNKVSDLATKTTPVSLIKIGDKIRVKPSVHTPKHDWGNVTLKSVGVVQAIKDDGILVVDFPGHANWKGILSEMELITVDNEFDHSRFKIGSSVRVKASVDTPEYGWGDVTKNGIGILKAVNGDELTVDFPEHSGWTGMISEMELEPTDDTDNSRFKTGSRVHVKASVDTPEYGWGDVTKNSVGIVKSVDGDELTVDFPEHSGWTGMVSEMELY